MLAERTARGKAARTQVPRDTHAVLTRPGGLAGIRSAGPRSRPGPGYPSGCRSGGGG